MSVDERLRRDAEQERALEAVIAAMEPPKGPLDRIRSLPTWARRVALFSWAGGIGAVAVLAQGSRPIDGRLLAEVVAIAGLAAAGVTVALRPLHRPAFEPRWAPAAVVLGGTVLIAGSGLLRGLPTTPAPEWPIHLACWIATTLAGAGVIVGGLLVERGGGAVPWRTALLGMASGTAAFAFQTLVCPVVEPTHVFASHASAGVWLASAFLLYFHLLRSR